MKNYKGKKIHYAEFTGKDEQGQDFYLYKGFCQKNTKPHGQGKLFLLLSDNNKALSSKWFQEGLWLNGKFYKGTYDMCPIKKEVGYFFTPESDVDDIELHGEGAEYFYGSSLNKYKNDKPIGSVTGTFKRGSLIKGKITNAFKIRYTEYDFIKHIHYEGFSPNKEKDHLMRKGKIFYKNGDIFEGKMIFDAPEVKGKLYVAKTKKTHLGLFKGGNFVKWITSKKKVLN